MYIFTLATGNTVVWLAGSLLSRNSYELCEEIVNFCILDWN